MKILALYDNITKKYVENVAITLESLGYSVIVMNINDYVGTFLGSATPTFLIRKEEKDAYAIQGKQPIDVIIDWAKNSGAQIA